MKTLFISNDPAIFDANSGVRERMRAYAGAIGTVHIISLAKKGTQQVLEEIVEGGTLTLHAITGKKPLALLSMRRLAHDLILKEGIEIVSTQDPFEHGWVGREAVKGTTAKLHVQVHTDFLSPWFVGASTMRSQKSKGAFINKVRVRLAKRVLSKADGIRVVSERIGASLTRKYGTSILAPAIIPLTVPATPPQPVPLPTHPFTFALIAVGRLEPEKRIEDILMALSQVTKLYPSVGLIIVGEGREYLRLLKLTAEMGLSSKVMFLGNRTDAWGLMQNAQAFIQASAYEGYGRTLVEAALARIPIITTDVGIVGEVFKGYEDLLAAPVGDPAALGIHIRGLIEDNQARHQYVMSAEKTALAHLANVHTGPAAIAADLQKTLTTDRI